MQSLEKYYLILGIQPGATAAEVKQAYRDSVRAWHPDRFAGDIRLERRANERLALINEAYEVLSSVLTGDLHLKSERATASESNHSSADQQSASEPRRESSRFITDLRSGEIVQIVDVHSKDSFYNRRLEFLGSTILVKDPIHKGEGWYCVHGYFQSSGAGKFRDKNNEGVLFAYVRVSRHSQQ